MLMYYIFISFVIMPAKAGHFITLSPSSANIFSELTSQITDSFSPRRTFQAGSN